MAIEIYIFKTERNPKDFLQLVNKIRKAVEADRKESLYIDGFYLKVCNDNSQNHVDKLQPDAYWCKANHIYGWISKNILGNKEGEQTHCMGAITKEELCKLAKQCSDVLKRCKTSSGEIKIDEKYCQRVFPPIHSLPFYGPTEYDEHFLEELEDTLKQVNNLLHSTDFHKYGLLCFVYA